MLQQSSFISYGSIICNLRRLKKKRFSLTIFILLHS